MSKHTYQIRTEGDRHPYIKRGYYWKCFSHLYANATDSFRLRMEAMKTEDETNVHKRSLGAQGSHYPAQRL